MITKRKLLKKVFQDGISIKEAATQIRINYSTAKTIIFLHRKRHPSSQEIKIQTETSSDFTCSNDGRQTAGMRCGKQQFVVCCSIGGVASQDSHQYCSLRKRLQLEA